MIQEQTNRRKFLADSGRMAVGGWLAAALPLIMATAQTACSNREEDRGFAHLEPLDARDLEAIAEQIMPADDTPGAREAGVIWFIDGALGGFRQAWDEPVLSGLQSINDSLQDGLRFAELGTSQQVSVLKALDHTPFFQMMHFLTVAGMFAMPDYGGNRNKIGWALLGFEDRHAWQPPFGFYDKEYSSEASS